MDEENRMNFNSFVDAYNAYQNPDLAAAAPAFGGYGYQAPQLNMVQAPNQLPQMSINPDAIYDPTVGAAMQILNRPMMMAQTPELLGAGTDYQTQFGLLPNIASQRLQSYQRMADPTPVGLMDYVGGGGGDYGNYDPYGMGGYDPYSSISYEQQNRDLVEAGYEPMGYNEGLPSLSGFEYSPGDSTVYSQDTGYDI